jgi:hypothetical protein
VVFVDLWWWCWGASWWFRGGSEGGDVSVLVVVLLVVVMAFGCFPYALWGFSIGIGVVVLLPLVMFKWW